MMYIVKVPGINGEKTKGCRNAGNAIIKEFKNINMNEGGKKLDYNSLDFEEIHVDNSDLEESDKLIEENSLKIFEIKPKTVFLGGDNSISYSILKAFLKYCKSSNKKPCLIVFDAHADLSNSNKIPDNRSWLRSIINEGFPAENILLVGVRTMSEKDFDFIKTKKIKIINMNRLLEDLEETCDGIMEFSSGKELYVSIDLSAIDSAFVPSVNHSQPGGLSSREFIYLIQRINKVKNLRGMDIVEVDSEKDAKKNNLTVKLAAKILAEVI